MKSYANGDLHLGPDAGKTVELNTWNEYDFTNVFNDYILFKAGDDTNGVTLTFYLDWIKAN